MVIVIVLAELISSFIMFLNGIFFQMFFRI